VVEHDDNLLGIVHLQDIAPRTARKTEVDQDGEIDINDGEIARPDFGGAARPRQDFLDDRHAHRGFSLRMSPSH